MNVEVKVEPKFKVVVSVGEYDEVTFVFDKFQLAKSFAEVAVSTVIGKMNYHDEYQAPKVVITMDKCEVTVEKDNKED